MNERIRILYFMDGIGNGGGIQEMVINWVSCFDKKKYIVDILSYDTGKKDDYIERFESIGGKVYIIPSFAKKGQFFKSIKATKNFFKERTYDIVHAHASSKAYFILKYAKKCGIKVRILHSHCTQFVNRSFKSLLIGNLLKPLARKNTTHFFACSHEAGYFLFGKKKMSKYGYFIPNGIDLTKFNYNPDIVSKIKNELDIKVDDFVVGNIGRFRPQKNHQKLLNIFVEVLKLNPKAKLVLCGNGELLDYNKRLAKELNIADKVMFLGYRKDINEIIQIFDILVMPSLFEGLPVTAVESEAIGIPCLFSDAISKDTAINPNCKFMSLKEKNSLWAEQIIETANMGLCLNKSYLYDQKYDINIASEYVCSLYNIFLKK